MATKEEIETFLNQFYAKLKVFDIVFRDDRGKNLQALAELDITPGERLSVIKKIKVEDYSEGPLMDILNRMGDMWVFGRDVKGREVYIKISLGISGSSTICISFHIAERPMCYPYKKEGGKK